MVTSINYKCDVCKELCTSQYLPKNWVEFKYHTECDGIITRHACSNICLSKLISIIVTDQVKTTTKTYNTEKLDDWDDVQDNFLLKFEKGAESKTIIRLFNTKFSNIKRTDFAILNRRAELVKLKAKTPEPNRLWDDKQETYITEFLKLSNDIPSLLAAFNDHFSLKVSYSVMLRHIAETELNKSTVKHEVEEPIVESPVVEDVVAEPIEELIADCGKLEQHDWIGDIVNKHTESKNISIANTIKTYGDKSRISRLKVLIGDELTSAVMAGRPDGRKKRFEGIWPIEKKNFLLKYHEDSKPKTVYENYVKEFNDGKPYSQVYSQWRNLLKLNPEKAKPPVEEKAKPFTLSPIIINKIIEPLKNETKLEKQAKNIPLEVHIEKPIEVKGLVKEITIFTENKLGMLESLMYEAKTELAMNAALVTWNHDRKGDSKLVDIFSKPVAPILRYKDRYILFIETRHYWFFRYKIEEIVPVQSVR